MKRVYRFSSVMALALAAASPISASSLRDAIEADYPQLEALFRHFHAHPELSMQEFQTADRLARELESGGASQA